MDRICFYCFSSAEGKTCPCCGRPAGSDEGDGRHIKPGTSLRDRYIIGHVFSEDPIGVTYYGYDRQQNKKVWIREYLPKDLAGREDDGLAVQPLREEAKAAFAKGKERFVRRAKALALFNTNPGVAKMECYFEENGTGYIAMDRPQGKSLPEHMQEQGGRLEWFEALQIMSPVMNLLQKMHTAGDVHGYVSPANLWVNESGQGVLLNFNMLEDKDSLASCNAKYLPEGSFKKAIGPWVDVYSVAATIYHMVAGTPPASITDFLTEQVQVDFPSQKGAVIPPKAEEILMQVLKGEDTPYAGSIEAFERGLLGLGVAMSRRMRERSKRERPVRPKRKKSRNAKKWIWLGPVLGAAAALLVMLTFTCVRYFGAEKLYRDGMEALGENRTSEAVSSFKMAMNRFPWADRKYEDMYHETKGKDFYKKARKAIELGSYEQALNLYEQALKEDPQNDVYTQGKRAAEKVKEGYLLYDEGQFAKAKLSFEAALGIEPSNSYISGLIAGIDAWSEGRDAFYDEDYEAAYKAYSEALEYDEQNSYYMILCDEANSKWQANQKLNEAMYYYDIEEYIFAYEALAEAAEWDPEEEGYDELLEIFYGLAEIEYFFDVLLENEYTDYDVLSLSRITEGPHHLQSVDTLPANWDCMCIYIESPMNLTIRADLYLIDGLSEDDRIYLAGGTNEHELAPEYGLWIQWDGVEYSPGNYCIELTRVETGDIIAREYVRVLFDEE